MKKFPVCLAAFLFSISIATAEEGIEAYKVSVLAGRSSTPMQLDGIGENARFESITALWGDGGNLYVADSNTIRRIDLNTARASQRCRGRRGPASIGGLSTAATFMTTAGYTVFGVMGRICMPAMWDRAGFKRSIWRPVECRLWLRDWASHGGVRLAGRLSMSHRPNWAKLCSWTP